METCCAEVWTGFHSNNCGRKAKVERDGEHYCGTHDPVAVKTRRDKQNAIYDARSEARNAVMRANDAYNNIAAVALDYFDQKATHDDLEKAVLAYRVLDKAE